MLSLLFFSSGIGFLGGGLILKDGLTVRGLNTAATIWCSAACGTLSGVGLYKEAAILVICVLLTHCLFRPLCALLEKRTAKVYHYSIRAECQRNASNSIQKLIMDTLAFDQDVQLNSLFYKGDDERVTVCCDMATLGEHKVLLDLVVSRLRSRSEVYSVGWEKKESPQEDFWQYLELLKGQLCVILISYAFAPKSSEKIKEYVFNASTYFIMALRPVSVILQMVRGFTPEPSVVYEKRLIKFL